MIRIFYIVLASLLFSSLPGCGPDLSAGADLEHATQVTFDQFREATKEETAFWWLGCDADFQYFRTKKGFYRISREFEILDPGRTRESARYFEGGAELGDISEPVMIYEMISGSKSKLSYPPLDDQYCEREEGL